MARTYPLYLDVGTSKYGVNKYGDIWQYGLNYPPPTPYDLTIQGGPTIVDGTPTFSWANPTFGWEIPFGDTDAILYELQISYLDPSFASLSADTDVFSAPGLEYELAPQYTLGNEGTYYARIRSTDGYTYSDWSATTKFVLYLFGAYPPTIDPVTSPADGFWQVVTGTKGSGLYVFLRNNNGEWIQAEYPNGISAQLWSYNVPLVRGNNFIEVVSAITPDTNAAVSSPVSAKIYLIVSVPKKFNVWNSFDEFGLLLGLPRIPGEENRDYKARLLDVHKNKANATYSGLVNGISRELGLSTDDIDIERLSDLMDASYPGNLLNDSGNAIGTKLVGYADEVYDHNPIFFGNVICDESYWDGVDEDTNGYSYLPHIWDPTPSGVYDKWKAGGIGDEDDLWINDPIEIYSPDASGYAWYMPIHTGFFYSVYPSGIISP